MKYKLLLPVFALILFICTPSILFSGESQSDIDNLQGQGFYSLSKKDQAKAGEFFKKAGELSVDNKNWEGCLDASTGLIALQDYYTAQKLLKEAEKIIENIDGDIRPKIALANTIASMPPDKRVALMPEFHLDYAFGAAKESGNSFALIEIGKSYAYLKDKVKAQAVLKEAELAAAKHKDIDSIRKTADVYKKLGLLKQAQYCEDLEKTFYRDEKDSYPEYKTAPPAGWQAAGETIAGPKPVDLESGKMIKESADKQISDKRQAEFEQQKLNAEQKKWFYTYEYYYGYPYYYEDDYVFDDDEYEDFCESRLSLYKYQDGTYIRVRE